MIVFGIDPGPESCGVAFYDTEARRIEVSRSDMPVETVLEEIRSPAAVDLVACCQSLPTISEVRSRVLPAMP